MAQLAFYKGKGRWTDGLIRWVTRSEYSHVELILEPEMKGYGGRVICYSSSARDGGVRAKSIVLNPDHWDLVDIEWYLGDHIADIFIQNSGAKYDYWGLLFSQFFNWRRHNPKRWFCSEIIGFALGIPFPQSYSPGGLKLLVEKLNQVHRQGVCEGRKI